MDLRAGIFLLFVLGSCSVSDARPLEAADLSRVSQKTGETQYSEVSNNDNICTLCEEFTTDAINYLSANKTQTEIIDILHKKCSLVPQFKQECITLVDYYGHLFFKEISLIKPEEFCLRVDLCHQIVGISSKLHENSCGFCRQAVSEILIKLEDPDTELEIIKLLLKICERLDSGTNKCKTTVFRYGPLILSNAVKFLETNDVCTMLHACAESTQASSVLISDV